MKTYSYRIDGADYDVTIQSISGQKAKVEVNGLAFEVEMQGSELTEDKLPDTVAAEHDRPVTPQNAAEAPKPAEASAVSASGSGEGTPVKAPLPGVVTKVNVTVGQQVKRGEAVLVLEAMKMENEIYAPCDGTVAKISVQLQQQLQAGSVLMTIA